MKNLSFYRSFFNGRFRAVDQTILSVGCGIVLLSASLSIVHGASAPVQTPGPTSGPVSNAPGMSSAGNSASTNTSFNNYNPSSDNPGLYSNLPSDMPEGLSEAPESIWKRDSLLGDLGGERTKLENHGVTINPVYTGEVFGNISGHATGTNSQGNAYGQGIIYDHSLNVPITIDLEKVASWWKDATFHANALWIAGPSLSTYDTGDISNTSNIAGYNTVRLQELWYQQAFWDKRASLKVGLVAADTEFFTSNTSSLFINGTFGAFTFAGFNLPNTPVYPMAAPAVRLLVQPVSMFYFQTGVFDGNTQAQNVNNNGTAFHLSTRDGALIFSEVGYLLNQSPGQRGLQGTYKLGSFVHTENPATFTSQTAVALGNATTTTSAGVDYGIYGIADQQIYQHDEKVISAFTRVGAAPGDENGLDWYVDGGFNFTGFVEGRHLDVAGIAVARSAFSSPYSTYQVDVNGTNPYSAETVLEATYKAQISPWWTVQPDFQYIFTPSGQTGSQNAAVVGVRTTVAF